MKKLLLFLFLFGAALAGIALWAFYPRAYVLSEHKLQFATLQHGSLREVVSASGRLEPRETIAVSCEVPGAIVKLFAKINDVVGEGALLAQLGDRKRQLDCDEARAGVDASRAALAQAKAQKKSADLGLQYQIDLEKKGGFRSERDQAQVNVEAAAAGVRVAESRLLASETGFKKAQEALDKTQIKVPVCQTPAASATTRRDFVILDRHAQIGQFAGPQGPPLFLLTRNLEFMDVHTQVAEGDIARVRKGLPASFTVQAYTDEDVPFEGLVKEIRPLAVNAKGAVYYDTIVEVLNKKDAASGEWRLRPGMTASVDIIRREHKDVWKIPTSALNFTLDEAYRSEAARQHVADWQKRTDAADWQAVWIWDKSKSAAWPVFIRLGGVNKNGEPGLKDTDFNEILEWEPGREPDPREPPRIIIGAPPARSSGIFDQPWNIKVS